RVPLPLVSPPDPPSPLDVLSGAAPQPANPAAAEKPRRIEIPSPVSVALRREVFIRRSYRRASAATRGRRRRGGRTRRRRRAARQFNSTETNSPALTLDLNSLAGRAAKGPREAAGR